jgi:hypothetical protein
MRRGHASPARPAVEQGRGWSQVNGVHDFQCKNRLENRARQGGLKRGTARILHFRALFAQQILRTKICVRKTTVGMWGLGIPLYISQKNLEKQCLAK